MIEKRISLPKEMWESIDERVAEGNYSSRAEYVRTRFEAGESTIQELDPRNEEHSESVLGPDLKEEIQKELSTDFQTAEEIQEKVAETYKEKVSDWLINVSENENSPVERSGLEFRFDDE